MDAIVMKPFRFQSLNSVILTALVLTNLNLSATTLYVSLESTNPVPPFATWASAATSIQDAVDAAQAGDTVLVTNGVYAVGGRTERDEWDNEPSGRVVITIALNLESVNGPLATTIEGAQNLITNELGGVRADRLRCVYLGTNATLSGFTLRGGYAHVVGGGVYCGTSTVVTNCILRGNSAFGNRFPGGGVGGGGAYGGTLYDCSVDANSVTGEGGHGGGANRSTLYNCSLTGNWAWVGGGVSSCTLYGCTLTGSKLGNRDKAGGPGILVESSTLHNCMVTGGSVGGARSSTLYNCTVTGNSVGGTTGCSLFNCVVTGNDGGSGGEFYNCTVIDNQGGISGTAFNSIVYYNSGGNYGEGTTLNYCCTAPLPTNAVGNISGPPLFMDMAAGDFHLREDSPCVDAGTNLMGFPIMGWDDQWNPVVLGHITDPTDMLGNTRFIDGNGDGTVAWDIGAYEFNSFKPPRFSIAPRLTANGWRLNITGAPNKWVHLQRSSNLKNWEDVWTDHGFRFFMGSEGVMQVTDWDTGPTAMFYRVIVQ